MRAIKSFGGLKRLLTTLITSLPALAIVLILFFLIILTYAALGMHLFRNVHWGHDAHANFCTLLGAILTMYRCTCNTDRVHECCCCCC
jgi:hypothetical protein